MKIEFASHLVANTLRRAVMTGLAITAALVAGEVAAQEQTMDAARLAHALDRLANTGRVLYIAAHPDDENTRLLAYLANARHVTAAYLSLTRGGGGQNLIGAEQDELLDVIRTEELLAARRLDGATQRFTRLRDFGFSKTAAETLAIWDHDEALADVVWVIRTFQPDLIVTRFDERPPNHGHHTASAILAREAFSAAADPQRFADQLAHGAAPWQAKRLLLNVPTWREGPLPAGALPLDVGLYDARLGLSFGELAALSRSQHKSQGFGVAGERGPLIEHFVSVLGDAPERDILENIDLSWQRFGAAGELVHKSIGEAQARLSRDNPEQARAGLLAVHAALVRLPDGPRVRDALRHAAELIAATSGLFLRATSAQPAAVPGGVAQLTVEAVLRRPARVVLRRVVFAGGSVHDGGGELKLHEKRLVSAEVPVPADAPISTPYWLQEAPLAGRLQVKDQALVGAPQGPPALAVRVEAQIDAHLLEFELPVVFVWNDRVHGERLRSFLIVPPATVTPVRRAVLLPNGAPQSVVLRVRAGREQLRGDVRLELPGGWQAKPASVPVDLARAGDETSVRFDVTAAPDAAAIEVQASIDVAGRRWSYREDLIDYAHIPMQIVLQQSALRLVPVALKLPQGAVGYIPGSGDSIAEDLKHIGVDVTVLDDEAIRSGDLSRYAAVITGIRAYNTSAVLRAAHQRLMHYVEAGGTLVVQYNTSSRLAPLEGPVGPYPLTIGRERITDETAAMRVLQPDHGVLQAPNAIGAADFDGWVQERGLYFAETWDERYQPIFEAADAGETSLRGSTLVARHGRGKYVYTGLSFFRQLPAGVAGAYRLFLNLLAPEKD